MQTQTIPAARQNFPISVQVGFTVDDCQSILTTFYQSGFSQWAEFNSFRRDPQSLCITAVECRPHRDAGLRFRPGDPRNDWQTLAAVEVAAGLVALVRQDFDISPNIRGPICDLLVASELDEADAEQADCIMQAALFKKLVFF